MHKLFLAVMEQTYYMLCFHHVLKIPVLLDLHPQTKKHRHCWWAADLWISVLKEVKWVYLMDGLLCTQTTVILILNTTLKLWFSGGSPATLSNTSKGDKTHMYSSSTAFRGPTDEAGGSIRGRDKMISLGAWTVMSGINTHNHKPRADWKSNHLSPAHPSSGNALPLLFLCNKRHWWWCSVS